MKTAREFLLEFEKDKPVLQNFLKTKEDRVTFYNSAQGSMVTCDIMYKYSLYILEYIFENGLGEIDENCSKDDLIESYLEIKKLLGE